MHNQFFIINKLQHVININKINHNIMIACISVSSGQIVSISGNYSDKVIHDEWPVAILKLSGGSKLMTDGHIYKLSNNSLVMNLTDLHIGSDFQIIGSNKTCLLIESNDNYYYYNLVSSKINFIGETRRIDNIMLHTPDIISYIDNTNSDNKLFIYKCQTNVKYKCDTNVNCIISLVKIFYDSYQITYQKCNRIISLGLFPNGDKIYYISNSNCYYDTIINAKNIVPYTYYRDQIVQSLLIDDRGNLYITLITDGVTSMNDPIIKKITFEDYLFKEFIVSESESESDNIVYLQTTNDIIFSYDLTITIDGKFTQIATNCTFRIRKNKAKKSQ